MTADYLTGFGSVQPEPGDVTGPAAARRCPPEF